MHQYRSLLIDEVVPFWFRHGVDREYGGVLSCMTEDGHPINSDKYIWSQARWVWVASALVNRIEKREQWLESARKTVEFLLKFGRDAQGRWLFCVSRTGEPLQPHTSIFSDCFAVYGLSEYYRASKDEAALSVALEAFHRICRRVEEPDFRETAPAVLPAGQRPHAVPMILTEVASELAITTGDSTIEAKAEEYATRVMGHFLRPELRCLVESLDWRYRLLPGTEGTAVEPGHAIESMWFILHWAMRRNRQDMVTQALESIRWHLELGWDREYGGLFLGADAKGGVPHIPNWDKKVWWPHTEALYALYLAQKLTTELWPKIWLKRIEDYCQKHFYMPGVGEWRQRLNRDGQPIDSLIALPVKDPFHLPRALILLCDLPSREKSQLGV